MSTNAPKIDPRSAPDIVSRLVTLLEQYTSDPGYSFATWKEYDPTTREPVGRSAALIRIFARFGEIVIERLNQVPEKNFLAYLNLLGAARQPPQPARVPLSFTLAAGSAVDASVPQGTQVAAPPAPGEKDPVVFETERPLVVTAARLDSLLTLDPEQDSYGDWSGYLAQGPAFPVFQGDRAFEHVLYLGDSLLLGYAEIRNLRVSVTLEAPLPPDAEERQVRWEYWGGTKWHTLTPVLDPTDNLVLGGTVELGAIGPLPESAVNSQTSRWMRCRLLTPITRSEVAVAGMVRDSRLPRVKSITTAVHLQRPVTAGLPPDLGFTNAVPLDLSKEFFPFGEKPKLHDTLFLASAEAFSKDRTSTQSDQSATVQLAVQVANSHLLPGAGSVFPSIDLELAWEACSSGVWERVGTSVAPAWLTLLELDPTPSLRTEEDNNTYAILQGTARKGAEVTWLEPVADRNPILHRVSVGVDGRFAAKRVLLDGLNVLDLNGADGTRSAKAWAVVYLGVAPTVELDIQTPSLPVEVPEIKLEVIVRGADADKILSVVVNNGTTGESVPPQSAGTPIVVSLSEGRNDLLVEAFDAQNARLAAAVTTISRHAAAPAVEQSGFSDGTFGLCQSGVVTLRLPDTMARIAVNGQESFWLRVRPTKGDYGKEASYVLKDPVKPEEGFTLVPASFRPPIVAAIRVGYDVTLQRQPELCFTYNQLAFRECASAGTAAEPGFAPFVSAAEAQRAGLYLGLSLPAGRSRFPNETISLYNRMAELKYGERAVPLSPEASVRLGNAGATVTHTFTVTNTAGQREDYDIELVGYQWPANTAATATVEPGGTHEVAVQVDIPVGGQPGDRDRGFLRLTVRSEPGKLYGAVFTTAIDRLASPEPPTLAWQYWDGARWSKLAVQDGSENFTRSGMLELLAPPNLARRDLFGRARFWLRVEWDKGEYPIPPRLERMLINTALALQTTTVVNEILGSSNGAERQKFHSTRAPVLAGQRVEVREREMPSAEEQQALKKLEGGDAIKLLTDSTGAPREIWVRWHEVPDFYGSGPGDRHYVINHITGEIEFGDGAHGRIPPRGAGNLRLASYRTGGGRAGNRAADTVVQLKTTVPYIEKATNPVAAAGGAEAEDTEALFARMPRTLRHRDRAVTLEDYEDLALLASPEVARARCVPLRDLAPDPLAETPRPGFVSVIVVPRASDVKPLPTRELLGRVDDYLAARATGTASLAVVGPLYLRVDVRAEIAVTTPGGASNVERAVHERLAAFLHPLTGGVDGGGWGFGRAPYRSDFFALIESVPGVDHIRFLQITEVEDQPGVRKTSRFLVFSGEHQISLVLEKA
jgi:hypothetical protein